VVDCIKVAQDPAVPVPAADDQPQQEHPDTGSEHVVMLTIGTLLIGAGLAARRASRRDELAARPSV
jgi:LPXTG-motif cell wall-anchored protein